MSEYFAKLEVLSDVLSRSNTRPWWETGSKICNLVMFLFSLYAFRGYGSEFMCIPNPSNVSTTCEASTEDEMFVFMMDECQNQVIPFLQRVFGWWILLTVITIYIANHWWLYVPVVKTAVQIFGNAIEMGSDLVVSECEINQALNGPKRQNANSNTSADNVGKIYNDLKSLTCCKQIVMLSTIRNEIALVLYYLLLCSFLFLFGDNVNRGRVFACDLSHKSGDIAYEQSPCYTDLTCKHKHYVADVLVCVLFSIGTATQAVFTMISICRTVLYRKIKLDGSKPSIQLAKTIYILAFPWLDLLLNLTQCGCCDGCNGCCRTSQPYQHLNSPTDMNAIEFLLNMENRSQVVARRVWLDKIMKQICTDREAESNDHSVNDEGAAEHIV